MRRVLMVTAVMMFMGGCLFGCVLTFERDSSFGVELTSGIKFYQSAPDDGSEARVNLLPEVWERIKKDAEEVVDADNPEGD